jgi:hypothetical protein
MTYVTREGRWRINLMMVDLLLLTVGWDRQMQAESHAWMLLRNPGYSS